MSMTHHSSRAQTEPSRLWRTGRIQSWFVSAVLVALIVALGSPVTDVADDPSWMLAPIVPALLVGTIVCGLAWLVLALSGPSRPSGHRAATSSR